MLMNVDHTEGQKSYMPNPEHFISNPARRLRLDAVRPGPGLLWFIIIVGAFIN